uniref:Predicted protein n=1 Tax=Hordeum vulgare subsp. vulgare TaxID=112509 RepID=F2DGA0_HORVV|nr:predicted protein [Hordeum vulgare subsp. vulgare]
MYSTRSKAGPRRSQGARKSLNGSKRGEELPEDDVEYDEESDEEQHHHNGSNADGEHASGDDDDDDQEQDALEDGEGESSSDADDDGASPRVTRGQNRTQKGSSYAVRSSKLQSQTRGGGKNQKGGKSKSKWARPAPDLESPLTSPMVSPSVSPGASPVSGMHVRSPSEASLPAPHPGSLMHNRKQASFREMGYEQRLAQFKEELVAARKRVNMLRAPVTTLRYFSIICYEQADRAVRFLLSHRLLLTALILGAAVWTALAATPGDHHKYMELARHWSWFFVWWLGLGVASSIGLGSGLHTGALYLFPYVLKTVTTAIECRSLDFPSEGPNAFECSNPVAADLADHQSAAGMGDVTVWGVYTKVALAVFLWGGGTAIGELPPYFVARAARLTGQKLEELEELDDDDKPLSYTDRAKHLIYHMLQKYGFLSIMLFASVPNPLFDLAGLTCGHFLVPFWTFFLATFIGKAVVKATGQNLFLIYIALHNQERLEHFHKSIQSQGGGLVSRAWDIFITLVVGAFLLSIVNTAVQERLANEDEDKLAEHRLILRGAHPSHVRLLA